MPRLTVTITSIFLLLPCLTSTASGKISLRKEKSEGTPDFSSVRQLIREQLTSDNIPSLSVAVVHKGKIIWEEGFGWADRENRIPATEHTVYSVASVTKNMTATALMILHERKLLDLDHPANDYLGPSKMHSYMWNPNEATVRRVAMHTAGLSTFDKSWSESEPGSRLPMDEIIRRYGVLLQKPGNEFDYSNLGYGILGEIVERVSGKSYADFLQTEVFWPLGMTHSSINVGRVWGGLPPRLTRTENAWRGPPLNIPPEELWPSALLPPTPAHTIWPCSECFT